MTRTFRSWSAGVLAMGLLVAGCSDDKGNGSATNLSGAGATTSTIVETEETGAKESHFKEGMHTPFLVT